MGMGKRSRFREYQGWTIIRDPSLTGTEGGLVANYRDHTEEAQGRLQLEHKKGRKSVSCISSFTFSARL